MLLYQQGSRIEIARPQVFSGKVEEVSAFVNAARLYIRMKMTEEAVMGIKRFDHKTKVKARSERRNLQAASQLCTKQVGTREINQIIESLLKVKVQRITKTYQIET